MDTFLDFLGSSAPGPAEPRVPDHFGPTVPPVLVRLVVEPLKRLALRVVVASGISPTDNDNSADFANEVETELVRIVTRCPDEPQQLRIWRLCDGRVLHDRIGAVPASPVVRQQRMFTFPDTAGEGLGPINFGHQGPVVALAAFPDGHRFASIGVDRPVRVWDLDKTTGEYVCVWARDGHEGPVECIHVIGLNTLVAGYFSGSILRWSVNDASSPIPRFAHTGAHASSVTCLSNMANARLVSGSCALSAEAAAAANLSLRATDTNGEIRVWHSDGSVALCTLTGEGHDGHIGSVTALVVRKDNKLVSGGSDGTLRLWDIELELLEFEPMLRAVNIGSAIYALKAGSGGPGRDSVMAGTADGRIECHSITAARDRMQYRLRMPPDQQVWQLHWLPDGQLLSVSSGQSKLYQLRLWDVTSRACVRVFPDIGGPICVLPSLPAARPMPQAHQHHPQHNNNINTQHNGK